jgi:hypothetical protein
MKLTFCSCVNEATNKDLVGEHKWILKRFKGSRRSSIMGERKAPNSDLGEEITLEDIAFEMNSRNCFDFDYVPEELDCFHLENGLIGRDSQFFSLIYKKRKWVQGQNPGFERTIEEDIATGKVERTEIVPDENISNHKKLI